MAEPEIHRLRAIGEERVVYILSDADRIPIYVGCTRDFERRVTGLRTTRWWSEVEHIKLRLLPRDVAARLERELIETLRPLHNKAGVTTWYSPPTRERVGQQIVCFALVREIFRLGLAGAFEEAEAA
jgi:excinuclease UvrABC nuclease subunit